MELLGFGVLGFLSVGVLWWYVTYPMNQKGTKWSMGIGLYGILAALAINQFIWSSSDTAWSTVAFLVGGLVFGRTIAWKIDHEDQKKHKE